MARLDEIRGDEKLSKLIESLYKVSMEEAQKLDLATVIFKEESRCIQCGLCGDGIEPVHASSSMAIPVRLMELL